VRQDVNEAKADGIQATPSFLINGNLIEGAAPFDEMKKAIDSAIKGN